jgi:hypothetical protein
MKCGFPFEAEKRAHGRRLHRHASLFRVRETKKGSPLGSISLIFGVLGGIFCWWTPMGMILSLTGILLGFAAWMMARKLTAGLRISVVASWYR